VRKPCRKPAPGGAGKGLRRLCNLVKLVTSSWIQGFQRGRGERVQGFFSHWGRPKGAAPQTLVAPLGLNLRAISRDAATEFQGLGQGGALYSFEKARGVQKRRARGRGSHGLNKPHPGARLAGQKGGRGIGREASGFRSVGGLPGIPPGWPPAAPWGWNPLKTNPGQKKQKPISRGADSPRAETGAPGANGPGLGGGLEKLAPGGRHAGGGEKKNRIYSARWPSKGQGVMGGRGQVLGKKKLGVIFQTKGRIAGKGHGAGWAELGAAW